MLDDIEITRADAEPGAALLTVSVPAAHVEAVEQRAAQAIASRAKVPGFRPGKIPLGVVRRHYRDAIRDSVVRDVLRESWEAALEREGLTPIGEPHVHNLKFETGVPMTFEIRVDVKPELRLDRLSGFRITRRVEPVTDEMVGDQLERLRAQRAPWAPVGGDAPERPRPGDLVSVSLAVLDGSADEARPYQLVLGEGQALAGVEEQIMAMLPGESAETAVRFPDDHPDEAKRGVSREVRITLHEAKRQELPALDDDFAREVGDFDTLDALREAVREDLQADAGREADARVRSRLIEEIAQANAVLPPRGLVERVLVGLANASGVSAEQWERFSTELRPVAEAQVRRDLILDHVAEAEGLRATEAEIDERVRSLAERRGQPPGELYARLEREGRLRDVERSITEEKVYARLLSQSTITEG